MAFKLYDKYMNTATEDIYEGIYDFYRRRC